MRFGIDICILGELSDPRLVVDLAVLAEDAGWDAVFVWDHLAFAWGVPAADPWVTLAAVAQATSRIRIGTAVAALPRRRPATIAAAITSLDLLSGGRFVLGAGLGGVEAEYTAFGEAADATIRAEQLDESLDVLSRLWSGEPVTHHGKHYTVDGVALAPVPVQRPRVPVWIGGGSKSALRRAARWDGWLGGGDDEHGRMVMTPDQVAAHVSTALRHRTAGEPFEVALIGASRPGAQALFDDYAESGVTWWLEHIHGRRASHAELKKRIAVGP
jgi:probable F420-dependent oxidoreductase